MFNAAPMANAVETLARMGMGMGGRDGGAAYGRNMPRRALS
jgi:hypothetical protein